MAAIRKNYSKSVDKSKKLSLNFIFSLSVKNSYKWTLKIEFTDKEITP
jgi:hypothetical protein